MDNGTLTPSPAPGYASPSPSQSSVSPSQTSSAPPTGVVENSLMHKDDLYCHCHKLGIPLPVYQTAVEGCVHALRFRSTVSVDRRSFTSPNTFANRKSAEQDAAKLALEHLVTEYEASATNLRVYLRKLVCQDKARCKMILNEFTAKMKMESSYKTVQVKSSPPFVSTLTLNGTCYKGEADDPTYATPISKVIKSKFNVSAAFYEAKDTLNTRDFSVTSNECKTFTFNSDVMPLTQQVSSIEQNSFIVLVDGKRPTSSVNLQANNIDDQGGSEILANKNKQGLVNSLPQTEKIGGHGALDDKQVGAGLPTEAMTISRCSYVNLPITSPLFSEPQHEIKLPEAAQPAFQKISVPIEFVLPPAQNLACDTISSKK